MNTMLAFEFLVFAAVVAVAVATAIARYMRGRDRILALTGLIVWLTYTGLLGYLGVIGDASRMPPGPSYVLIPVILFVALFLSRSDAALRVAEAIPLGLLLGAQIFRVVVELFLHRLAMAGLAPQMLTYDGANFDIVVGLTAPLVAWLFVGGRMPAKAALAWNVCGLAMLANIVVRAVLTTPGTLQVLAAEVPNRAIGIFPFTFIPGLMAPLALVLHVLAIRALRARLRRQRQAYATA